MSRFLTMVTIMKLSSLVTRLFFDDKERAMPKRSKVYREENKKNEFIEPFLDCRPQIKNLLQM